MLAHNVVLHAKAGVQARRVPAGGCRYVGRSTPILNRKRASGLTVQRSQKRLVTDRSDRRTIRACATTNGKTSDVQAVCLGEALFDMLANQFDVPREEVTSWEPHAGGAPCNVSAALAKLGINVAFVSALGKDDMGDQLMSILKDRGVDLESVQRRSEPTRDVYVTRTSGGEREFSGFGLPTDQYCDCFVDTKQLPVDKIQSAEVLVTGTLGLAYPATAKSMRSAVSAALASNTLVLVDVNWRPVFFDDLDAAKSVIAEYVKLADIVKLTDEECEWLFGVDANTIMDTPCKMQEFLPNAKGLLVTGGEKGASYCFAAGDKNLSGFIPVFDVNVVDTTGAGDAFTAGFIFQLLSSGGFEKLVSDPAALETAISFASACGGLTTTAPGAIEAQPPVEDVSKLAKVPVA